jgi:group II intron reverse transcriptase/maturase
MDTTKFKLTLIAEKAKANPQLEFTSLMHLLNEQYLLECYKQLKRHKAPGIDQRTVESYSKEEIKEAIRQLVESLKAHRYKPQPVRRVYIPKANGKQRPLGIPTVMDRILQRALANILEPLFEPLFQDNSYGFRPNRSAQEAIRALNHMVMAQKVNWIIDADIRDFFGSVNHTSLMDCLKMRISDPNILRLIAQFLKAGVMDAGIQKRTDQGTPQGGIVSPILANIYLHYALDRWLELKEKPQLKGYIELVRYADDFVIGVQYEYEAKRLFQDISQRFAKCGLSLAEDKTRIVEFGRFAAQNREARHQAKPETFDFLGFTHYCSKTRDGRFAVKVKTSRKKFIAAIHRQKDWFKAIRTSQIRTIWKLLALKLLGHYHYYGVSGNFAAIKRYYCSTRLLAFKWLNRRSQKRSWNWKQFENFMSKHPLPKPELHYVVYNNR